MTLPKEIAYSEPRLQPPPGYKDTTVPGHLVAATPCSRTATTSRAGSSRPGMQGVEVRPITANMLTPESLAELMGGPDIVDPAAPPAFGVHDGNLPGPPNAYDENNPLPPPWYPQPGPPPAPAPGVIPVIRSAPTAPAPAAAPAAAPAPAGPPLPAEAGVGQ